MTAAQRWINLFQETRVSGVLKCLCLVCFCSKPLRRGEKTLRFPMLKIRQTQRWVSGQQPCATVMFTFYSSLLGILFSLCCKMLLCTSTNILAVLESQCWHSESFYYLCIFNEKSQTWLHKRTEMIFRKENRSMPPRSSKIPLFFRCFLWDSLKS